jgi:hypothetical protein
VLISMKLIDDGEGVTGTVTGRSRGGLVGLFERRLCRKLMDAVTAELRTDPRLQPA